jgi:hypothetical protein
MNFLLPKKFSNGLGREKPIKTEKILEIAKQLYLKLESVPILYGSLG